jgi:formate dehydrogenase beta subunit
MHEGIPIINFHVPKAFVHDQGQLTGMSFEVVRAEYDDKGRRTLVPTGEPDAFFECDEVLVAVGQETPSRGSSATAASPSTSGACRRWTRTPSSPPCPMCSSAATRPSGPRTSSRRWRTAMRPLCRSTSCCARRTVYVRPAPMTNLVSQKMGIHEWSYDNDTSNDLRYKVPWAKAETALASIRVEVELGFDAATAFKEAQRCLNCDVQTVFNEPACIECDACVDICPMDCISFTANGEEQSCAQRLKAPALNLAQDLYVSGGSRPAA